MKTRCPLSREQRQVKAMDRMLGVGVDEEIYPCNEVFPKNKWCREVCGYYYLLRADELDKALYRMARQMAVFTDKAIAGSFNEVTSRLLPDSSLHSTASGTSIMALQSKRKLAAPRK